MTSLTQTLDTLVGVAVWTLLLVLSALKLRRLWAARTKPRERESLVTAGQASLLPRRWQQWILGE